MGLKKNYFKNGKLESTGFYSDGNATGIWTYYHENGNKLGHVTLENGELNGEFYSWYENGRRESEGVM